MNRTPYPSDLTDEQWQRIAPLIPPAKPRGRPRAVDFREIINAILYWSRTGCQWRQLPHDLPPWGTVHYYHRRWRLEGVWQRIHDTLQTQVRTGFWREPTLKIVSTSTTNQRTRPSATTAYPDRIAGR
ncbi:MAG: Transposase [Ktedonobacterales bacterium]|jgi:transposase|nr:MAG: Transposase [Ktedonobacterales bacterium]